MALRMIENLGYYCVDNLPASLLNEFSRLVRKNARVYDVAIVMDARGQDFMKNLLPDLMRLRRHFDVKIVFFESHLNAITKRFKESRLRHPLALRGTIRAGYNIEERLLSGLRREANFVIDTSTLTVHGLKPLLYKYLFPEHQPRLEVHLLSFGFKHGVPAEADLVFDVRFLVNPFFDPRLKLRSGKSRSIQNFVMAARESRLFVRKTLAYVEYLLQRYQEEGKTLVTVAFGCTGGRHRSVTIAETLKQRLKRKWHVKVQHRDLRME